MKINVIRGENQIGGNIVEISTDTTKILLDAGLELDSDNKTLPDIDFNDYDAIFVSHYHADHIGLVYDIKENRRNVANENGINVYSSNDQLFKDPKVDIVVIATPNDTHKDLAIEALKNGKNVICEKPVEMSVEALDQMISASEKYNRFFTVHQNRRWDVDFFGNKKHC